MQRILVETMCLPPIPVMQLVVKHDALVLEGCENYQKRSYRNRFYLSGPQGKTLCTIPLVKGKNAQMPIKEVRIANDEPWADVLIKLIRSNYGSAPFFDYLYGDLVQIFSSSLNYLWALNLALTEMVHTHLGLDNEIVFTEEYNPVAKASYIDIRGQFKPGQEEKIGISPIQYEQVFADSQDFIPHLSILDMLMCCGPESMLMLRNQ